MAARVHRRRARGSQRGPASASWHSRVPARSRRRHGRSPRLRRRIRQREERGVVLRTDHVDRDAFQRRRRRFTGGSRGGGGVDLRPSRLRHARRRAGSAPGCGAWWGCTICQNARAKTSAESTIRRSHSAGAAERARARHERPHTTTRIGGDHTVRWNGRRCAKVSPGPSPPRAVSTRASRRIGPRWRHHSAPMTWNTSPAAPR